MSQRLELWHSEEAVDICGTSITFISGRNLNTRHISNGDFTKLPSYDDNNGLIGLSVLERLANVPVKNVNSKKTTRKLSSSSSGSGSGTGSGCSNSNSSSVGGAEVNKILKDLEHLITTDDWIDKEIGNDDNGQSQSPVPNSDRKNLCLSDLGCALVSCSAVKNYIKLLRSHHKQCIASLLYGNTTKMLNTLFRTANYGIYCSEFDLTSSDSIKAGIGYAVRLALLDRYGLSYISKGWHAFIEMGAPVVYVSPALNIDLVSYLTKEFMIGDVIVLKKSDGNLANIEGRIDHAAFQKQLDSDIAAGKKPLIVIGVVGSPIFGQNDIISRLLEIRKSSDNYWVHVVGQGLSALCLKEPSKLLVNVLSQVDSLTVSLSLWIGTPPVVPVITLYRSVENHKPSFHQKLDTLPWWITCQYFTISKMTKRIENAYFLSKVMLRSLSAFPQIEIFGVEDPAEFANRVYKGVYAPLTVLVFKYKYPELEEAIKVGFRDAQQYCFHLFKTSAIAADQKVSSHTMLDSHDLTADNADILMNDSSTVSKDDLHSVAEYADSLNYWFGQGLISDNQELGLQIISLDDVHGSALRFCPLELAAAHYIYTDHIQKFIKQLSEALTIIDSTVAAKKSFAAIVAKYPSLTLVPVRKWAGVGAVCYVPSIVKETPMNDWNEKQRQQVSYLNLELVRSLRLVDNAFSAGESAVHHISCVKFGMLSDDKDLADLVFLVSERGEEIEHSQQYMDSLAEMIREGIETASEDLRRENDARLLQEGVIRQIPLMSSLVNWLSPMGKGVQNIKGRSFDLKTGQIQSTEVYYKNRLMNQTSVTSQEPHHTASKISKESEVMENVNGLQKSETLTVDSMENSEKKIKVDSTTQ
ncbi:unnamed protein product [Thelazia callipaeda]|uniref:Pyridoxal-dependent decarboxylase domain-containing protein 1 n=1 Tax=Thelazia callipaeda TaxID=103827 RepID=A0A0N5D0X4_THECL|nr:unnamed protein product [Thelazia callipaeda]